ncbi:MAG: LLM class flavin-dependent oxidoreductase [Candidatus Rokubacteria bacterium]|nr:LLM class flavin-dependent oxidoreductase [Candidatus Rokubacteria bacterium]
MSGDGRMKFGIFFLGEPPPWQSARAAFLDALDEAAYTDALGFDAVFIPRFREARRARAARGESWPASTTTSPTK